MNRENAAKKTEEKEFLTPGELAELSRMSQKFIYKHIGTRRLPGAVKVGGRWRFRALDVRKRLLSGKLLLDK